MWLDLCDWFSLNERKVDIVNGPFSSEIAFYYITRIGDRWPIPSCFLFFPLSCCFEEMLPSVRRRPQLLRAFNKFSPHYVRQMAVLLSIDIHFPFVNHLKGRIWEMTQCKCIIWKYFVYFDPIWFLPWWRYNWLLRIYFPRMTFRKSSSSCFSEGS